MVSPSLAELVRMWRVRALLTQEQLARATGLAVRTIRRLESDGLRRPRTGSLRLLADALKLDDEERAQLVAAAGAGGAPPVAEVPRQLPADVAGFVGRAAPLRVMDALADGGGAAVVISAIAGTAGVGKTALAVHWAHRVAGRFPDGQLYVNLRGFDPGGTPVMPEVAVRGFLDALGVPPQRIPAGLDAQAALYRSRLAGKRVLVVLDNVRDAEQVRPLLPGTPGCLALVTSRDQLTGLVAGGARPLPLDLLSTVEARELLAARLGARRVAAEPEAVAEVVEACARLPLALVIAAARSVTRPDLRLTTLAAELRDARHRLDALATGDAVTDVRAVFSWSYHCLGAGAARMFRLLGRHPGPDISISAAASLAGVAPAEVRPLLAELTAAHLLAEHRAGRYALHDLLRVYAAEQGDRTDPADEQRTAINRMFDYYQHTAYAADRQLYPHRESLTLDPPEPGARPEEPPDAAWALEWFTAERVVLLTLMDHAAATGWDTRAWQLGWVLATHLVRQGLWHDYVTTQWTAVRATRRLADPAAEARSHRGLAYAFNLLGRYDDAYSHLMDALGLSVAQADRVEEANNHLGLAEVERRRGHNTEALAHAQHALALYRDLGMRNRQANALNDIGWFHAVGGEYRRALAESQQALALHQESGDQTGEAGAWHNLGYVHQHLGDYEQALACYRRALTLTRVIGDRHREATALTHLGEAHLDAGDADAAGEAWRQALAILRDFSQSDADRLRVRLRELVVVPASSDEVASASEATSGRTQRRDRPTI